MVPSVGGHLTMPPPGSQHPLPVQYGNFQKLRENMPMMMQQQHIQQQQQQQQTMSQQPVVGGNGMMTFDPSSLEQIQVDPFHVDYSNQMMQSTESPSFGLDYNQQVGFHA